MTSFIAHTVVDCADTYELCTWWKDVLGYVDPADDPNQPGDEACLILPPDGGTGLLFVAVPDPKQVKNRLHLDLRPIVGTRDDEVTRLVSLGAREVDDQRDHYGPSVGWVVMADPEGNEFCVLRGEAEAAASREHGGG